MNLNNIGGYPDSNYNQTAIQWPLSDAFKESTDPSSLKLEAISWYQSFKDIDCLQLRFPNGVFSPVFGNTAESPDKSYQLPADTKIAKINFYHRKFSSTRLGCIEIFDQNMQVLAEIGPSKDKLIGTVELSEAEHWLGAKANASGLNMYF